LNLVGWIRIRKGKNDALKLKTVNKFHGLKCWIKGYGKKQIALFNKVLDTDPDPH
jgi:hypothetical protein